jgi:hypothetical protein
MPYKGEKAGKGGHADFVSNPDIITFLNDCEYLREPSDKEAEIMVSDFINAPETSNTDLPSYVIASDASKKDSPINDKLPSTQIGYIKISHVLVDLNNYSNLSELHSNYIDPFKVAEIHRSANPLTYVLPGSNIRYRNTSNVKNGFRKAVFEQLDRNIGNNGSPVRLLDVLITISDKVDCNGDKEIFIEKCPCCKANSGIKFLQNRKIVKCSSCNNDIYVSDWLRLHEDISDFGNNTSAMTRMMNALEHLLFVSLMLQIFNKDPKSLSKTAFILDGPLAVFGQPAKLHARIMQKICEINQQLESLNLDHVLIVGLQKTGELVDYTTMIDKYLNTNKIKVVSDDYRYKYIKGSDAPSENFGHETYYGQDFIYKTQPGKIFNFALPYPFCNKENVKQFVKDKVDYSKYGNLIARACQLINYFEMDLYENAIVPVALAHRHASISIVPGSKVLDIISGLNINR